MKYFVYCRKSSEDEERQALSILSQRSELDRKFRSNGDIDIVAVLEEEKSAKSPGRPVFGSMMRRIEAGEAEGIVAWAPDRLARNSIDGGHIIYQLDLGVLKDLKFATYTFENNPQGKFMLQIMFGQSKYYSDALSENVRRGNRTKVEMGWRPNIAPLGYLNDRNTRTIVPDPERFSLMRQMWELMLTGAFNPNRIREIANEEWGFRTRTTKRQLGGKLHNSTIYNIFSNPFYAGILVYGDQEFPGKHQPMVTRKEFRLVRDIIAGRGKPQPQKHVFAYTGLIRCGACPLTITAEHRINRFGSHYTYYHCTKRLSPRCTQPSIRAELLDEQIAAFLEELSITPTVASWAVSGLGMVRNEEIKAIDQQTKSLHAQLKAANAILSELTDLRLRQLLRDDEFVQKRQETIRLRDELTQEIEKREVDPAYWFEPSRSIVSFSKNAISWFESGDAEDKRLVLNISGSNPSLKNKILNIEAMEPFLHVPKRRSFLNLRAYVEAIRLAAPLPGFEAAIKAIQELEKRAARRDAGTSPTSLRP